MDKQKLYELIKETKDLLDPTLISKGQIHLLENRIDIIKNKILAIKSAEKINLNLNSKSKTYQIWTDGACSQNPGKGGWAAVIYQILENGEKEKATISGYESQTTNNKMELTAAIKALENIPNNATVELFSDSQYLQKGISQWIITWKKKNWKTASGKEVANKELWKQLELQNQSKQIKWSWVKGHSNVAENELCDRLARSEISKRALNN